MSTNAQFEIQFPLRAKPASSRTTTPRPADGRLPRIAQVLALAIHLEDTIHRGEAKDYADVARVSCLSRERVSQIARLNYLAPDIQVELLYLPPTPTGQYPVSEAAMRRIANLLSWADQRREWSALKRQHHVD